MAVDDLARRSKQAATGLKVSAYDRSSSLLIALLLMAGASVLGVVIVFFSNRLSRTPPAIAVTPVSASDTIDEAAGDLNEEAPGVENAPVDSSQDIEEFLDQVSLAAADDSVLLAEEGAADQSATRRGDPRGKGGSGRGTSQGREPKREIVFEPNSIRQYAEWFDQAGLEIAVLGSDNLVYYASGLSKPNPVVRSGKPEEEGRLYFNSQGSPLYPLDRQLARKAGIFDRGQIILQFCQPETQARLLALEAERAGDRQRSDISRTVFRVVVGPGGRFDFEVESQQYYR